MSQDLVLNSDYDKCTYLAKFFGIAVHISVLQAAKQCLTCKGIGDLCLAVKCGQCCDTKNLKVTLRVDSLLIHASTHMACKLLLWYSVGQKYCVVVQCVGN